MQPMVARNTETLPAGSLRILFHLSGDVGITGLEVGTVGYGRASFPALEDPLILTHTRDQVIDAG